MKQYFPNTTIAIFCILGLMGGCSHYMMPAIKAQEPQKTIVIHTVTRDTITVDGKHMTPTEYQAYLQKFYESNYNKLISPEFKHIADNNKRLIGLINIVVQEDYNLRDRTRHFRDSTNKKQDSTERDNAYWKSQAIKNARENAANLKKAADNATISSEASRDNLKLLAVVTGLIIIAVVFLYRKVSKFEKNLTELRKAILTHE